MNALVCIARVPDTTAKISFNAEKTAYQNKDAQWIVNPYDEWYALGRAIELREKGLFSSLDIVTVGNADAESVLRKAMALGGDRAFRIDAQPYDSLTTAYLLHAFVKENAYDIILGGKETIDYNDGCVMPMLANYMGRPFVGQISHLDIEGDSFFIKRQTAGAMQSLKARPPVVCSCQKGLAEPRLPGMKNIIAARTKKIEIKQYDAPPPTVDIVEMDIVSAKKNIKWIDKDNPRQLFALLKEDHRLDIKNHA